MKNFQRTLSIFKRNFNKSKVNYLILGNDYFKDLTIRQMLNKGKSYLRDLPNEEVENPVEVAIECFKHAIDLGKIQGCSKEISESHEIIAEAYYQKGDYKTSILMWEEALKHAKSDDEKATVYMGLGDNSKELNRFSEATKYYNRCISLNLSPKTLSILYYKIGLLMKDKMKSFAQGYFKKAYEFSLKGDYHLSCEIYQNMKLLEAKNDIDLSEEYKNGFDSFFKLIHTHNSKGILNLEEKMKILNNEQNINEKIKTTSLLFFSYFHTKRTIHPNFLRSALGLIQNKEVNEEDKNLLEIMTGYYWMEKSFIIPSQIFEKCLSKSLKDSHLMLAHLGLGINKIDSQETQFHFEKAIQIAKRNQYTLFEREIIFQYSFFLRSIEKNEKILSRGLELIQEDDALHILSNRIRQRYLFVQFFKYFNGKDSYDHFRLYSSFIQILSYKYDLLQNKNASFHLYYYIRSIISCVEKCQFPNAQKDIEKCLELITTIQPKELYERLLFKEFYLLMACHFSHNQKEKNDFLSQSIKFEDSEKMKLIYQKLIHQ